MKKTVIALLLSVLIVAMCAGCESAQTATEGGETSQTFNYYLCGATPGGGGVWDMVGAGVAETIMKSNPGSYVTVTPGGGVSDVPVVAKKEAELGLTHNCIMDAALQGIDPFDTVYDNVASICALYPSMFQFIIKDGFANSIEEIIANKMPIRIAVGDPGSTGELGTRRLFAAYGVSYEDIEACGGKVYYKDMSEAATMLGDGLIDAFTLWTLAPAGPVQQVTVDNALQILSIDPAIVEKLGEFGYSALTIPQSAYAFMTGDVTTIGSKVTIITNTDLPEEIIYNITKSMVENIDYLQSIHSNMANLTPAEMAKTDVALHPGAEKYYKEAGLLG